MGKPRPGLLSEEQSRRCCSGQPAHIGLREAFVKAYFTAAGATLARHLTSQRQKALQKATAAASARAHRPAGDSRQETPSNKTPGLCLLPVGNLPARGREDCGDPKTGFRCPSTTGRKEPPVGRKWLIKGMKQTVTCLPVPPPPAHHAGGLPLHEPGTGPFPTSTCSAHTR